MNLGPIGIWSSGLRYGDAGAAREAAAEAEALGYSALWFPDVGGDVFGAATSLLDATTSITVATGILNLWMRPAAETAAGFEALEKSYPGRFLLGLGVSHAPLVDQREPGRYRRPRQAMLAYLDGLDDAEVPVPRHRRVLAALGPKMLETARDRAGGAHPYLTTPEHTAAARTVLGPGPVLAPEQRVLVETDAGQAREVGRAHLSRYLALPNYRNNLLRSGFSDDDVAGGGSDRLVDALIAWGDEETVARRVRQHLEAGADHVCIQWVTGEPSALAVDGWRRLAPALL